MENSLDSQWTTVSKLFAYFGKGGIAMGRHFFIDKDSGTVTSYTDEEIAQGGMVIGTGLLLYAVYGLICIALGAILVAPFVTLFLLEGFVDTIVVNNWLFFTLTGVVLLLLKLISVKTAKNFFVRFFFNAYVVTTVLYITLYVLHLDSTVYSFARVIGNYVGESHDNAILMLFQNDRYYALTEGNWFYEAMVFLVDKFIDFVVWSFGNVIAIDNSCFTAAVSDIDIFGVLKTCVLYVGIGGFAVIGTLVYALVLLVIAIISVALPYFIAFVAVILVNTLINKFRFSGKLSKKKM